MKTAGEILAEHGIRPRRGHAFATTCPECSTERKKKRAQCLSVIIDDRGVRANCHHCGWRLVAFFDGPKAPNRTSVPISTKTENNDNGRRALGIWREGEPLIGSPGQGYLRARGITELPFGIESALRFHPKCPFNGSFRPCVLALYRDVLTDEPKAIHRIAPIRGGPEAEKMAFGPKTGCAIKLCRDEDVEQGLTIGEGVETTLAAWQFGFRPAWACGDAGNLAEFQVLPGVDGLHVVVDNDPPDERGQRKGPEAALECSARWTAAGRDVIRIIPDEIGADFNDIIRGTAP
jgi:hypothetical protein